MSAELYAALIEAQAEFGAVSKNATNPFFKSTYADLPSVKKEAQPVLAKHGLGVMQEPSFLVVGDKIHDALITTVIHGSGQSQSSTMILRPVKDDPQSQGSALSYAKRYAYMAVLGLVADVDDDGNAASRPSEPAKAAPVKPAKAGTPIAALKALCAKSEWPLEAVNALYLATYKVGVTDGSAEDVKAFTALLETGAIKVPA